MSPPVHFDCDYDYDHDQDYEGYRAVESSGGVGQNMHGKNWEEGS
jgi:hypothetical protein